MEGFLINGPMTGLQVKNLRKHKVKKIGCPGNCNAVTYHNWLNRLSAAPPSLARLLPNILYLEILILIFIAPPLQGDTN